MDGKYLWSLIATVFQKMTNFSRYRRPTGSHIHPKSGGIKEMARDRRIVICYALHITNRKYHMVYLFVPFPMTLDDLDGHLPNAGQWT